MSNLIRRLPTKEAKKIIQSLKEGDDYCVVNLGYPDNRYLESDFAQGLSADNFTESVHQLMDSDLGDHLKEAFGKHDGVIPGKYRLAQVFIFEFQNEKILAICEKGDRGSNWVWLPKSEAAKKLQYQRVNLNNPLVIDFWPAFLCLVTQKIGNHPIKRDMLSSELHPYIDPFFKEDLEKTIPLSLSVSLNIKKNKI